MPDSLVHIENVTKHFPVGEGWLGAGGVVHALDEVSLDIASGEAFGLVGESGSGKSTLGRCSLALLDVTRGTVEFEGRDLARLPRRELRRMRRHMQMVFQDPFASLDPRMLVVDILAEPFRIHDRLSSREVRDRSRELLRQVGMRDEHLFRYPHEFSGGQRQRLGIARALALRPKYVVADEPVSALDVSVGAQIVNLLQDLQQELQLTYLFISHSLPVVRHIAQRVGVMYLGKLVEVGAGRDILESPLHPYTVLLLSSTPDPARPGLKSRSAPGELPSAIHPPSGCRFRTRCPLARGRCAEQAPPLRELGPGHFAACHFAEEVPARLRGATVPEQRKA